MTTPSVPLRLWYLLGGRVPQRYREWVFQDATGPKWMAWFTLRALLRNLPLSAAITLGLVLGLGGSWGLAIACGGLGLIVGLYYTMSYAIESTEYRITRYGYPHGAAATARKHRTESRDAAQLARYNAAWRN
ncbi:DUF5313 family protein [Actinokineospora sp. HUAS TT18]|uniref:DUF5313 family protein n=1 Tax=Actinokineospora sp. HUAS TT18 TaxID=3447451 RepID=UPI003F528611